MCNLTRCKEKIINDISGFICYDIDIKNQIDVLYLPNVQGVGEKLILGSQSWFALQGC